MNQREDRINYAIQGIRLHMDRELEKSVDDIPEPKTIKPEISREDWIKGNFPKGTKVLVV